ncbi:hypothetical protein Gxy13693_034_004 [Komagataeibacter xylinus NBRC 13693]|uniref:Uncharacterized protein n=1 Tax=Komagataeibacter xylinus NBRC 13693 TaxID=1234668 RepID=A0A0D6Q920_KOMXY|nr:hypothetical protein Gxy13693_034_004 [Komagataeibacter xylinus NBRC 13693]
MKKRIFYKFPYRPVRASSSRKPPLHPTGWGRRATGVRHTGWERDCIMPNTGARIVLVALNYIKIRTFSVSLPAITFPRTGCGTGAATPSYCHEYDQPARQPRAARNGP